MATPVNNPTNSPARAEQALPFIRNASGKATVAAQKQKDAFNSGKDYIDEGAPLLTVDADGKKNYPPAMQIVSNLILPPTKEDMEALSHPDEASQTKISYLREAVVMDVDAKLIISTEAQMKRGYFREAHYPTLIDYVNSPYYRKLRESKIVSERLAGLAYKTKLREAGQATVAGIRLNPQLVNLYKNVDRSISRKLKESGFDKHLDKLAKSRKLREDSFTQDGVGNVSGFGQFGPNWDGGRSFGLAGREVDFTPLMAGPYNKQLYWFDYLDMHSKAFEAWTHNPVAKRIVKVITQFVLGKGVKLTVMRALQKSQENSENAPSGQNLQKMAQQVAQVQQGGQPQQQNKPDDWKARAQTILDRHWAKNKLHIRGKKILRDLIIFGEQFPRYFDAPWGLKLRQIDPSTVWEVVTDPDDCENEFYLHQQYPTRYQWYVDLPVPTIKFIIRQVPAGLYYHMKINDTAGEVRGRSEIFAILGWLKRLKEYASDRVIRNKMANLFVLDVAVEGDAAAVQQMQQQFSTPPTPGSFFIHNKAAELNGVAAEVGASETQGDWEMLLTVIAMGAGISQEYLGMGQGAGGKAQALVGTEPDIKTFEDYQELAEDFFLEDAKRVFERAKEKGEVPKDLTVTVEATFPALAEENRSEKLKDYAFGESMSWWSHRRTAAAAAKEMQMTSYDYDQEQQAIAEEDAMKQFLINTAYQQVTKGVDSAQAGAAGGGGSSGTSSGSSGKGASGMGPGKALPSTGSKPSAGESKGDKKTNSVIKIVKRALGESDEDTAPGTAFPGGSFATTHNASVGADGKRDPWSGRDPRDMASNIKREAANLRYQRHGVGRMQDRVQSPHKIRDQKSLDRGDLLVKAKRAARHGNLNKEAMVVGADGHYRFPREREGGPGSGPHGKAAGGQSLNKLAARHFATKIDRGEAPKGYSPIDDMANRVAQRHGMDPKKIKSRFKDTIKQMYRAGFDANRTLDTISDMIGREGKRESLEPFKPQDGERIQRPRVDNFPVDHKARKRHN